MTIFPTHDEHALALDDGTNSRSFAGLEDRIARLGRFLRDELGLPAGGHVALLSTNRIEGVELVIAALVHGIVLTPVSHHLAPDEIAYVLEDSGARAVFVDPSQRSKVGATKAAVIDLGELGDRLAGLAPRAVDPDAEPGGTMIYTSGTSGRPKGVIRARAATVAAALAGFRDTGAAFGFDGAGPHLVTGPLYHAAPLMFAIYDLFNGAPLIVMPRWDERAFVELVRTRKVAHTHLVPTTMVRLLRLPIEDRPASALASLTLLMHGAAPILPSTKRAMIDWLGAIVTEYWGATEGGIYTLVSADEWLAHPGTVGKAIGAFRIDAVDDDGATLPRGESGTLVCTHARIAEPFVYHRDPEKTARSYLAPHRFTVGDLGWIDADGFVFLGERRSNLILSGGVNIYPAEIERVLSQHPAIADVAVFGVPDEEWGETVVAAVELHDGYEAETAVARIGEFATESLASFKRPRAYDVVAKMPRTEAGKLRARDLRDEFVRKHPR